MASDVTITSRSDSTHSPPASPPPTDAAPDLQFILKFKSLPELWDKHHADYSNKYKRIDALKKLLPILKQRNALASVVDVRKKINTIRTNYRRERKRLFREKRAGSDDYVPKGRFFDHLSFLFKTDEDLNMSESSESPYLEETNPTEYHEWTPHRGESSSSSIIVKDEPKSESKVGEQFIKEYAIYDPISTSSEPSRISTTALYWTEKLDRLSNTQRIYAEKAINEILLEAELGNLDKNSVKINESD